MFALQARNNCSVFDLDHVSLGWFGEALIYSILILQGYQVEHIATETFKKGDLRAIDTKTGETFTIEVKTARKSSIRKQWQFCLNKSEHCQCSYADFIAFIAIDAHGKIFLFVSPTCFFKGTSQFTIGSHPSQYRGKLAAYRQRDMKIDFEAIQTTAALHVGRFQ